MAVGVSGRTVRGIQRALQNGPIHQDDLISALRQAGLWIDVSVLWEVCKTHGLADLGGDGVLTPRGWAAPVSGNVPSSRSVRVPTQRDGQQDGDPASRSFNSARRRAVLHVQRLADSVGLGEPEPLPPLGPAPAGWGEVVRSARRALGDELAKVTSRRTETDVPLVDGYVSGATDTRQLVRYEAQSEIGGAEGTRGLLIVGDSKLEADVISVFGAVVTLAVPAEARIASEATLRLDMSWLLNAQSKRLWELSGGGHGFHAGAAMAVVTPQGLVGETGDPLPPGTERLRPDEAGQLNDGQRRAVELALTPGTTWLWGPPGTGKTTTVSALIAALVARGLRVLLAAPTNAALDVAVVSLFERAPRLTVPGVFVRLGQPTDTLLRHPAGDTVLVDRVAAQRGALLAEERVRVGQRLREVRAGLNELRRAKGPLTEAQQQRRVELELDAAELFQMASELDRYLLRVRRLACREASVVAATAHQTVLETLKELEPFDVVVLDEASMTTAALAMLVAGAGRGHTVIAGDFRQLPPVVVADTPATREWLHKSPFEKAGVARAVQDGTPPERLAPLTEQYRMRPAIGHVVSTAFYRESPLVTAATVVSRKPRSRAEWATGELMVLDTSGLHARTARRQGSASRYNLMHAQLVAALLGGTTTQAQDLAMITPYAAQARLLESLLGEFGLPAWAASTVHRFQGGERDIVVYDTVDTGHGIARLHSWFTDLDPDSIGTRLLNVAASRAKDHLVVVGAFDRLHRAGSSADPIWRFFAHLLDGAAHLPWQEVIDRSNGVTERVARDEMRTRLAKDIEAAASVDMWLPVGPLVGLRDLLPALTSLPPGDEQNQPCTIWLEPEGDGYLPAQALQARREGVNIRPCTPVLESVAVVGDVVWSAGSSLLGPDPGIVLRTENRGFADLVRRTQRRRRSDLVPGSGQLGEDCGRCQRMLVRVESFRHGAADVRHVCLMCDVPRKRGRRP